MLHNIKIKTYDVDFIVEYGDTMRFELAYKEHCGNMIDVSASGECFGTRLPTDYVSQSKFIDTFGNITLRAMSVVDTIITKSTRSEPKDIRDIRLCSALVNTDNVLNRLRDYSLDTHDIVRGTVLKILR